MENVATSFGAQAPSAFVLALEAALDELARASRESNAEKRTAVLIDLARNLIAILPPPERAVYSRRLSEMRIKPPSETRGTPTYDNVVALLAHSDVKPVNVVVVQNELNQRGVVADKKSVHNSLNYLARKGRLKRIARGHYIVRDMGVGVISGDDILGMDEGMDDSMY
jgi:predicted transcriptional regulator of viral defense system